MKHVCQCLYSFSLVHLFILLVQSRRKEKNSLNLQSSVRLSGLTLTCQLLISHFNC